jgi:hypothetical protein
LALLKERSQSTGTAAVLEKPVTILIRKAQQEGDKDTLRRAEHFWKSLQNAASA